MSPPLISEYKKLFAFKRVCQTWLGGPKLFSHPVLISVQVFLFTLPAILLSVVHLVENTQDLRWRSFVVGVSMFLTDIFVNFLICLLKRGYSNVAPSESLHNFLEEEDQGEYEGFLKPFTWNFVAPNSSIGFLHLFAIGFTSVAFASCTHLVFHPDVEAVVRGFGIFALCIGRYTALINMTPEVATFDAIKKLPLKFYRSFYILLIGAAFHITHLLCGHVKICYFSLALALLPIFWGLGILPPVDALLPWAFETIVRVFGGVPSYYYFGTVLTIIAGGICTILAFVAAGQNHILMILLQCFFGYIISCDIGAILNVKASLCEEIPARIALLSLLKPVLAIWTSICCLVIVVVVDVTPSYHHESLIGVTLTIAISSWLIRHVLIVRKYPPPKWITVIHTMWDGSLTFLLHIWLTYTIHEEEKTKRISNPVQSLLNLFDYMLTIRGFAISIYAPKMTALDLTIATLYEGYAPESWLLQVRFVIIFFMVSLVRQRLFRLLCYLRMIIIMFHACLSTPLLDTKWILVVASIAGLPLTIASLMIATMIEGCILVPLFTLPIFLVSFPRPASFWKERWFPQMGSSKQIRTSEVDGKSLDWTIYAQIAPVLTRNFVRKAHKSRLRLEEGHDFIARYEDRLIFLRVVSSGWNFVYIQVKGLEMQEQTSCHHQEAAWMDEIFERAFGSNRRFCSFDMRRVLLSSVKPQLPLIVTTYADSKSTLENLQKQEEIRCFQNMFYRAFSYLWIKKNPVFKGESYQRPIASGYHLIPPGGMSVINITSDEGSFDERDSEDDDFHYSKRRHKRSNSNINVKNMNDNNQNQNQNQAFSMSKALFEFTMINVNAIPGGNSFRGNNSLVHPSNHHIVSPLVTNNTQGWSNGFSFPHLPGMDTSSMPVSNFRNDNLGINGIGIGNGGFGNEDRNTNNIWGIGVNDEELWNNNSQQQRSRSRARDTMSRNSFIGGEEAPTPEGGDRFGGSLTSIWVKKCVGESIPSNAVRIRVQKLCSKVWRTILGRSDGKLHNDLLEIDLCQFYNEDFWKTARKLAKLSSVGKISIEEITVKAFRYAAKLTLDEIYSGDVDSGENNFDEAKEDEIFNELTLFEKNHKFSSPKDIPMHIDDRQNHIVSMSKTDAGQTQMRLLNFNLFGVDFWVGKISQFCVEGIWGNLNLELLYLTSDDDERFSIQHDRYLMRNISTQCANSPLGYAVYDETFKVNLFDNTIHSVT